MGTAVQKWGNSLGVRIPKQVARQAKLRAGTEVDISLDGTRIVLEPVTVPSLKDLLSKIEPDDQPELVDWGKPVGKEIW